MAAETITTSESDNYYYDDDYDDEEEDEDEDEMMSFLPTNPSSSESRSSSSSHSRQRNGMSSKQHSNDYRQNNNGGGLCLEGTALVLFIIGSVVLGFWWTTKSKSTTTTLGRTSADDDVVPVQEWHDLRLKDIGHWCLDESDQTSCDCINPLQPVDRADYKPWSKAHNLNVADATKKSAASSRNNNNIDVVFLGDSITEGWKGMRYGTVVEDKRDIVPVFESFFNVGMGGDFDGLALGIAGDKSPNLLWRIQNGEIPSSLQPKVWWILIGTNDFLKEENDGKHCSVEVVFMGIKRVVEEIRFLRPNATIVVNGILPRTEHYLKGKLVVDPQYQYHPKRRNVWNAIIDVNNKLDKYCSEQKDDKLRYFDGKKIFVRKKNSTTLLGSKSGDDEAVWYIPQKLMGDYLHPTVLGYTAWGKKIVKTLHSII